VKCEGVLSSEEKEKMIFGVMMSLDFEPGQSRNLGTGWLEVKVTVNLPF
jgi:hypothetical protein